MVDAYNRDPASADSLFAEALRSGEAVISNDLAGDARVANRAALTRDGNYSLALLPLQVDGRLAGLVALRAREPGFFDQEELRLLSEMVSNISFALELMEKQDRLELPRAVRPAHRAAEPHAVPRAPDQALEGARRGQRGGRARAHRPRALQGDQRHARPADRRPRAAGASRSACRRRPATSTASRAWARTCSRSCSQRISGAEEVARRIETGARRCSPRRSRSTAARCASPPRPASRCFPDDGADADALLRNAEAALKRAKETGERYLFYAPEINARVSEQVELESRLRKAVEQGELFLHYQPKFDLATRKMVGVEALMRWRSPDGGLVSPARFVPVLEQTGLIFEAGQQVLVRGQAHLPGLEGARPERAAHRGQRVGAAAAPQDLRRRRARGAGRHRRPTAAASTSRSPRAC